MDHICKLPVGAWGYWGHKRHEYYYIKCNRSIDELRDLHFSCFDVLGFDVGSICAHYAETEVNIDIARRLETAKINVPIEPGPDEIFELWMNILQHIDISFRYEVLDPPDIAFVGKDSKGRTFDAPGYGVFD